MKFPRAVRLDASDTRIYAVAAEPGEWAVPGGFLFSGRDLETLGAKERLALRSGWLGTESFGWTTLVEVAEIEEASFYAVIDRLARHFVAALGAPDHASALLPAREMADDAAALCDHKVHTLLALERELGEHGLVERFRVIAPERATDHARIWQVVPDEDESGA